MSCGHSVGASVCRHCEGLDQLRADLARAEAQAAALRAVVEAARRYVATLEAIESRDWQRFDAGDLAASQIEYERMTTALAALAAKEDR